MVARYVTHVVFSAALLLTVVSIGLTVAFRDDVLVLLAISVVVNLLVLFQNERGGFVRSSQIRRAYEPARHLNVAQISTLFISILAQFTLGAYVLIT